MSPNITHRPFKSSFPDVQPRSLHQASHMRPFGHRQQQQSFTATVGMGAWMSTRAHLLPCATCCAFSSRKYCCKALACFLWKSTVTPLQPPPPSALGAPSSQQHHLHAGSRHRLTM